MRNEPTTKTAAVEPSADRARLRPGGERQKDPGDQAHNVQRDFHTINLPPNSATILGGIADAIKHRHAFELVNNHGPRPVSDPSANAESSRRHPNRI